MASPRAFGDQCQSRDYARPARPAKARSRRQTSHRGVSMPCIRRQPLWRTVAPSTATSSPCAAANAPSKSGEILGAIAADAEQGDDLVVDIAGRSAVPRGRPGRRPRPRRTVRASTAASSGHIPWRRSARPSRRRSAGQLAESSFGARAGSKRGACSSSTKRTRSSGASSRSYSSSSLRAPDRLRPSGRCRRSRGADCPSVTPLWPCQPCSIASLTSRGTAQIAAPCQIQRGGG